MKRFPELKPNFWDVIVVLAVIALAALSAMGRRSTALPRQTCWTRPAPILTTA